MPGLLVIAPGFAAGMLLLQRQAELPPEWGAWACLAVSTAVILSAVILRGIARNRSDGVATSGWPPSLLQRASKTVLVLALSALAGVGWAALRAHHALADELGEPWEGRDIAVTGVIAELPQAFDRGVRFAFEIESAEPREARVPSRVSLAWYTGQSVEEAQEIQPVRAGERWRFTVRLRRLHGSVNPHGFDFDAWMLERGLRATGVVRAGRGVAPPRRIDELDRSLGSLVERARERLRERFWDALPEARYAGILVALAIGDQRAIEPDEWQVFSRTGVSHLMSISGLHVTMISGLVGWLVFSFWRRVPRLALGWPAQKAGALAAALGALAYCLISGFAVPAQRTLYMVSVVALALLLDRTSSALRVLALALVVVLLIDPWAVLAPGFWLSFAAVAVIFVVSVESLTSREPSTSSADEGTAEEVPPVNDRSSRLRRWGCAIRDAVMTWGRVQWAVTVGLVPLTLVLFGQFSLVSPLANAIAIPVVSFIVTPLALSGALLPFDGLLVAAEWVTAQLVPWLQWLSQPGWAVWQQHAPLWWSVPPALAGVILLLAPRGRLGVVLSVWQWRAIGGLLMLPALAVTPAKPRAGELWLTVLDVGQGLAVVARTANHALVYDTGPMWNPQADSGSRVVLPYLRGEGVDALDALVVSHDDSDHSGGAASVLAGIEVRQWLTSVPTDEWPAAWRESRVPYRLPCRAPGQWTWDGVQFEWLHPASAVLADPWGSPNDRSCVLRIGTAHGSVLLTGDIEKEGEAALLASGARLRSDVLVVPHHGSGTSSTPAFVESVSPAWSVFSVGHRNRFGHPRADVWSRHAGSQRLRTDADGAVTFRMGGGVIETERARVAGRRYWHGR
jgi:competence protein ComEC